MNPTALSVYINWLTEQLNSKTWGTVSMTFTLCNKQVTDVSLDSKDTIHIPMKQKGIQ